MNFQLLRVKRRADQDPASSLYFPIESEAKRTRTTDADDLKEFRLFKMVERGNSRPTRIIKPTEREEGKAESKVILISDSFQTSTVADAILIKELNKDKQIQKQNLRNEISKLVNTDISTHLDSLEIEDDAMNGEYVYDLYRMDLGRFTSKDIEGKTNCLQIVTYDQEFLSDEEVSQSETYQDDDDSNAEDYFANDYPDEESYLSDNSDSIVIADDFDDLLFDKSIEIEEREAEQFDFSEAEDEEDSFAFDLDSDDYKCSNDSFSEFDDSEELDGQLWHDHPSETDGQFCNSE